MVVSKPQHEYPLEESFTRRERDILALLCKHMTNPEIAAELQLALSSVKWYVQQIYGKLDVNSRREAIIRAHALGLIEEGGQTQTSPKPVTPSNPPHNLPRQLTRLIGRDQEITYVKELLEEHALVTLTGSGGVGKTRLSLKVAEELVEHYPDGVWMVELAPLTDPSLLMPTVAAVLGLKEEANRPIQEVIVDFLLRKQTLLVLDNCEHLSTACARLSELLLKACPGLKLLVSSRELLGVSGEMPYRVPSLDFPDPLSLLEVSDLENYAAVRLFQERAQVVQPGFRLTELNCAGVTQICQRLDGIPLAIELAAARLNVLAPEQLAARLDDAFYLLTGGSCMALPRHQTLRATIDWSYQLLSESERVLLHRLSIFAGGWSLEAAEAICHDDAYQEAGWRINEESNVDHQPSSISLHPFEFLDLLSALINKSLVITERKEGFDTRYRLLETVHQYAHEKLVEAGEYQALSERHGNYFMQFAEIGGNKIRSAERLEWTRRLRSDLDNLRMAIKRSYSFNKNIETGLRIATAIGREFVPSIGILQEGRQWLLTGLSVWDPVSDRLLYANALTLLSYLDFGYSISVETLQRLEESLQLCRSIGSEARANLAWNLSALSHALLIYYGDQDLKKAHNLMEEAVALARQLESTDRWYQVEVLGLAEPIYKRLGDDEQARSLLEETYQMHVQSGDRWRMAEYLWKFAYTAEERGDYEQACAFFEQALDLQQEAEDHAGVTLTYRNMARVFRHQGDYPRAIAYNKRYLRANYTTSGRARVSDGLRRVGIDQALLGCNLSGAKKKSTLNQAVKILAAAEILTGNERVYTTNADMEDYQKALEILHSHMDPTMFAQAWNKGQGMGLDEAVRLALELNPTENRKKRSK